MPFTVTRQHYWYAGQYMVEIVCGGIDEVGADTLARRYPGEMREYHDPKEALRVALAIRDAWQIDKPQLSIAVTVVGTGGIGNEGEAMTESQLYQWAQQTGNQFRKAVIQ